MNKTNRDLLRMEQAGHIAALSDTFQQIIADYGFLAFELVETTDLHPHTPFHFGTAEEWRRTYIAHGFRFVDPYLAKSRHVGLPFDMSAIDPAEFKTKPLMRLLQTAQNFGIQQCLFVPHHLRTGEGLVHSHFLALIWMRPMKEFHAMLAQHRHTLHILALHFLERVMILRGLGSQPYEAASALTEREREMLTWASQGLTTDDIAGHLQISAMTAETHLRNAIRKLSARNRTHAVSIAIARGLIRI